MKRFTVALLLLCALPAMASAQMVTCTDCTHEVSVYNMGDGGFVAQATTGTEMVTYVSHCGGVTSSGQIAANADGLVAMLFTSCSAEGGRLELGPVMDGGWFWVTDDMNSAVGPLVNQSVLDNATTMITSAGASVTMMAGKGAVYMKEMATGRVGILPNILPEAPTPAVPKCGYRRTSPGNDAGNFAIVNKGCALGDGGVVLRVRGPVDPYTGLRPVLQNGATVVRSRTGDVTVLIDAWGNGTGHFTTGTAISNNPAFSDPRLGHLGTGVQLVIPGLGGWALPTGPGGQTIIDTTTRSHGLEQHFVANESGRFRIVIKPSTTHCGTAAAPLHHAVGAYFEPALDPAAGTSLGMITPPLRTGTRGGLTDPSHRLIEGARFDLTVACP